MKRKIYYKAFLEADYHGLYVYFREFTQIRETPCYALCADDNALWLIDNPRIANKPKLKRIHKTNSRFAFDTKNEALKHLILLKTKQNYHLERQLNFNKLFLALVNDIGDLGSGGKVMNTQDTVHTHLNFDY